MPIITKQEQLKKAEEIEKDKSRADTYRWWEINGGKKLELLEVAFKFDATDEEACFYAEITPDQLYYYQREIDKTFQAKKAQWKQYPMLVARQSVVSGLKDDPDLALKYLERKKKDEFSLRSEITGKDGKDIITSTEEVAKALQAILDDDEQTDKSDKNSS